MRKLKIYLDTSVISHLKHEDALDKMTDTLKLWEEIKHNKYDVITSQITIEEIERCREPKQSILYEFLSEINFTIIEITEEIEQLANQIISQGILTPKSYDDCQHIATAVISECDIIVSWNFKHMVNIKTINGIRAISLLSGYRSIDIYTPSTLIEGD